MEQFKHLLAGIFAALGALILEIVLDFLNYQFAFSDWTMFSLIIFVIIEESAKFFAIRKKMVLQDPLKIILGNCAWIGLGFGLLEFGVLLLNGNELLSGNIAAILSVILLHILTAMMTGSFLAMLKNKGYSGALAFVPSLIAHLAFNYWIFSH